MYLAFSYHLHYISGKSSLHLRGEISTVPISLTKWKSQGILLTTTARPNTTAGQYFYLVINFGSWHKLLLYRPETNAGSWIHFSFKIIWILQVNCSSILTIFVEWGNIFSFIHVFHSLILNKHSLFLLQKPPTHPKIHSPAFPHCPIPVQTYYSWKGIKSPSLHQLKSTKQPLNWQCQPLAELC